MGTGITTGPYQITAGQTISLNDPAKWSIASETIQLQNNTGFTIYVQSSGAGYNIQPFTVSTIPCAGGQTLVAVVSSTANVAVGFLTAVWLLPGQTGPMPDGPMTIYPKSVTALTVNSGSGVYYITGFPVTNTSITIYFTNYNMGPTYPYVYLEQATSPPTFTGVYFTLGSGGTGTLTWTGLDLRYTSQCSLYYGSSSGYVGQMNTITTPPFLQNVTATSSN